MRTVYREGHGANASPKDGNLSSSANYFAMAWCIFDTLRKTRLSALRMVPSKRTLSPQNNGPRALSNAGPTIRPSLTMTLYGMSGGRSASQCSSSTPSAPATPSGSPMRRNNAASRPSLYKKYGAWLKRIKQNLYKLHQDRRGTKEKRTKREIKN